MLTPIPGSRESALTSFMLMLLKYLSIIAVFFYMPVIFASDSSPTQLPHKANYDNEEGFAGPGSTVRQLEEDDEEKTPVIRWPAVDEILQPWFDKKKQLNEKSGLQLSLAYTLTAQKASDTLTGEDTGATGIFRVSGKWELFNRGKKNRGSLVFSVDNRSKYGDVATADLASEIGYIGPTAVIFSDADTVLVDFNWQQFVNDGNSGLLVGRYDPSDYMNVLGYANPWTTFQNLNVLLDSSVAYPDVGFGAGFGHWFDENWYFVGGFNDANGRLDETAVFDNGSEFFKFAEVGWSPGRDQRYFSSIHLTLWDVDEREDDGIDDTRGAAIAANWTWDETWMLFGRIGWSDVDAANDPQIYENSYTFGGLYYFANRSDLAGAAINYGELAAQGLDSQTTAEIFYRVQLAQNLAITPSIQLLKDPALNNINDSITLLGLRLRLSF
jgi:porin